MNTFSSPPFFRPFMRDLDIVPLSKFIRKFIEISSFIYNFLIIHTLNGTVIKSIDKDTVQQKLMYSWGKISAIK